MRDASIGPVRLRVTTEKNEREHTMPPLHSRHIHLAFDVLGCPNACRHCYLGSNRTSKMSEQDVRWVVKAFREYARPGKDRPFVETVSVSTWFREPYYPGDYRRLYALEGELSDKRMPLYELLSIVGLARDPKYAQWAKAIGTEKCQISFFGLEETTDWFYRRNGAFRDGLAATERLLDVGILPRWQVFLTKKLLPEADDLMRLIDRTRLRERAGALGKPFEYFMHSLSPDGEARKIEYLRPTVDELGVIPADLVAASRKHFGRETLWHSETELYRQIMNDEAGFPHAYRPSDTQWFFITPDFDVYPNTATLEPWWRLGNLKTDTVGDVLSRFERNDCFGLRTIWTVPARHMAARFGNPESRLAYDCLSDLLALYVGKFCEQEYGQ